jgi:hypothetical protein
MRGWQFRQRPVIFALDGTLRASRSVASLNLSRRQNVSGETVTESERRKTEAKHVNALKRDLNQDQVLALTELEKFGWELKFIRRPMFKEPIPVVFDSDRRHFAILKADGTLDENPGFDIRK